jgi:predicted restriction endonuclease
MKNLAEKRNHQLYEQYINDWQQGINTGMRGKTSLSHHIRKYLFEKYDSKCCQCGWSEINPYTNKIPLEVEHIDGDYTNNCESNLELLCPNCHSLTKTYKGANKNKGRPRSKYYRGT